MTPELLKAFMNLASRLSPENLHCDGEISRTEARGRERIIRSEWRSLEGKLGRKVSEDEVWRAFLARP